MHTPEAGAKIGCVGEWAADTETHGQGSSVAGPGTAGTIKRRTPSVRGERTRHRIAEAALSLLVEFEVPPTARDIAERSGVSLRLIFHHFSDLDELYRSVNEVYTARFHELSRVPGNLPLDTRIERTVRGRAVLYESIGNLGRQAMTLTPVHPAVAEGVMATHQTMTNNLECTFSRELEAAGRGRKELLAALDLAVSWHSWDRLRKVSSLSVPSSRRIMTRMLRAAVADAA